MPGMRITVLTIFPDLVNEYCRYGMVKRAIEKNLLAVDITDIRSAATDKHRTVDDSPYGGGAGMVMKADVLATALKSCNHFRSNPSTPVILMSPQGKRFDQAYANQLSLTEGFILVSGRYRGIDERFIRRYVTEELSIGDYVLTGGEIPAMVVIDSVSRLIPGVLGDFESGLEDSFQDGLLDCPWYTRPEEFEKMPVPEVLLSGDHAAIRKWRNETALQTTREKRPDLLEKGE